MTGAQYYQVLPADTLSLIKFTLGCEMRLMSYSEKIIAAWINHVADFFPGDDYGRLILEVKLIVIINRQRKRQKSLRT